MDYYEYTVRQYSEGGLTDTTIRAIREVPLTIFCNGREVVTLLCTARHPEYLAVGFLKSDAFLMDIDQLKDVTIEEGEHSIHAYVETKHDPWKDRVIERSITSGCGKGTNFARNAVTIARRRIHTPFTVSPEQILALVEELHARSTLYGETRGCHNSSLCTPDEMLIFREDIGRHNAIDMIVGQCFLEGISIDDKMVVSTGRIASEILLKVVRIGVPVMVSTAVATCYSVDLSRETGITLVGNVKNNRFWVYNDRGRISDGMIEARSSQSSEINAV